MSDLITTAVQSVSREHYTNHPEVGSVPQSTAQSAIERDLARAGIEAKMRVMEIGTGTGYTGALLADMVGPSGHVVSIDIDPALTDRAGKLHAERGVPNLTLVTGDGRLGAHAHGPYDVIVAWATPTHIPSAWVDQAKPGATIATPIYLAPVARMVGHVVVVIDDQGRPSRPVLGPATYIDMGGEVNTALGMPMFYVDADVDSTRSPAWISVAWRGRGKGGGPAEPLDMLREPNFTEELLFGADEREQATLWRQFRAYCAGRSAGEKSNLTAFGTGAPDWISGIGFSSEWNAAVLTDSGLLLGNREDSPAVAKLRDLIDDWNAAGRPGLESLEGELEAQTEGWAVSVGLQTGADR